MKTTQTIAILAGLLWLLPWVALAQPAPSALRNCLDQDRPASARVETCSRLIEATPSPLTRSQARYGRAQAGLEILGQTPASPPPAAYDAVLADLDLSLEELLSEHAYSLRTIVRFHRLELAPQLYPLFRAGEWERADQLLGPMIAAQPRNADLFFLRATFRSLTGNAEGAQRDRMEGRRLAAEAR